MTSGSSTAAVSSTPVGAAGAAVAAATAGSATSTSTTLEEESDVVIHEDIQAPAGVPAYLRAQKRNSGRRNYPSTHSRELIKNATDEFGDVADILTQMKQAKAEAPARAKRSSNNIPSIKKGDFENFKQAVELADEDDKAPDQPAPAERKQRRKKFASLRSGDKKEEDKTNDEMLGEDGARKRQSSIKRDEYKAQSAAFAAIELKDMVAVVKSPNSGEGAPKRRFASMKRESYKSFQHATADTDRSDSDDGASHRKNDTSS